MTTMAHVLTGAVLTQACGPALGLPLAVASHVALDFACRYHPPDLGWPWGKGYSIKDAHGGQWKLSGAGLVVTDELKALIPGRWVEVGQAESRLLWLTNAAAIVAVLVMGGYGLVDWYALLVGGLLCGWLVPDAGHLFPYRNNYPHRLADWLRARYWPRPVDEPWGAWAEAGLIVVLAIVAGVV